MHEISIRAEEIFRLWGWPVTNALLTSFLAMAALVACGIAIRSRLALMPGKLQNVFELFLDGALGIMDSVLGERALSQKYFPIVATIFLFILLSNWLGLFPVVGSVLVETHGHLVPLFRAPASDLNFTIALAVIAILGVNFFAFAALGVRKHLSKFFNFKNPIFSFAGILELISEFVKIISFSFRLFGNIFAGEVLLVIIAFLVPYFIPLPFLFLEVFVGFIQAFIFAMLTLVFIAMAVSEEPAH